MTAICIIGIPKYYKLTYKSILKHFDEPKIFLNIVDTFDKKYNTQNTFNIKDIINCYKPEKYIITNEYYSIYKDEQNDYQKYLNSTYNQYKNIKSCLELVDSYEKANNQKFKVIIKLRFDIYMLKLSYMNITDNVIYVEYHNKAKHSFPWHNLLDNNLGKNYDLIYDNKLLADYTDYIPDLYFYGTSYTILKMMELPEIIEKNYKKYDNFKYSVNLSTWFSYPEKLLLLFVYINKLTISEFGQGSVALLHQHSKHSIEYFNKLFNTNFDNLLHNIDISGNLVINNMVDVYSRICM
jgi:hypothetical protein